MPDFPCFDRDTFYNVVWEVVGKKVGYGVDCDVLTNQICDAVTEWVSKKDDFWLDEEDGVLYVDKNWEVVTMGALE